MSAPDEFGYTDAGRRYNTLLENVIALAGDDAGMVLELDEIVNERLAEVREQVGEVERLRTTLGLVGYLADKAKA